jgi:two-component sensor histidine kinase
VNSFIDWPDGGPRVRAFDQVTWRIHPEGERAAGRLPQLTAQVFFCAAGEAVYNAARYARQADTEHPLHLNLSADWQCGLQIVIEDNGIGLPATRAPARDSGQGLALLSTMMAVMDGSLAIASAPNAYTRTTLTLPASSYQRWDGSA